MTTLLGAGALAGAFQAAHEHGLFTALAARPSSAAELAESLGLAALPCERVLEVLRANGLLVREGAQYAPTAAVLAELRGPHARRDPGRRFWDHTAIYLRTGDTIRAMRDTRDRGEVYAAATVDLGAMFDESAACLARDLAMRFGDRPALRVLDVGAGSGVWSLAVLAAMPGATCLALDLAPVLPRFIERAHALGVGARVDVLAGDFHRASVGRRAFDVVILANVVHLEVASLARELVARWAEPVAAGGALVLVDVLDGEREADRAHAAYALHLGMRIPGAFPHHESDLREWLALAGLARIDRVGFEWPLAPLGALVARR